MKGRDGSLASSADHCPREPKVLLENMKSILNISLVLVLAALSAANSLASESSPRLKELRHESTVLGREMGIRVLLPAGYEVGTRRFPTLILLHGLGGDFKNWADKTELVARTERLGLIIVMPDGGDGWYTDSASDPKQAVESYLITEVIPFVDSRFRTIASKDSRFVAGLSMGGYGALKFGLKYPGLFSVAGSFSGALDAPLRGEGNAFLRPSITRVFGGPDNERRKTDEIFALLDTISVDASRILPYLYLDCGTEDWLIETNRKFAERLLSKKIPHEFRQLPGRHDWKFWNSQIVEFLRLLVNRGAVAEAPASSL